MEQELRDTSGEATDEASLSPNKIAFKEAVSAMETKLAAFYRHMAEKTAKARSKAILKFLAEEEEKHAVEFRQMSDVETSVEALNRAFQDAGPIMRFLVDDMVNSETLTQIPSTESEILKLAIRCEKDSILFFHELLKYLDDQTAVDQVEQMIAIEYKHLNELIVLLGLLTREIKAYKRPLSGRLPKKK
jgi:rubrerythrin